MVSIAKMVKELIDGDLGFQDALARNYANLSSIARLIKPSIEALSNSKVSLASIISALKRLRKHYKVENLNVREVIANSKLSVITDVAKVCVERNKRTEEIVRRIVSEYREEFLQITESLSFITIIFDQKILEDIKENFRKNEILEMGKDLAAIIVQSPKDIIKTVGCALSFYSEVSRRYINMEDTISCCTDTRIIVKMKAVSRAFLALAGLIARSRRLIW
ncbi:hypothetical protein HRbin06_01079 [archaeon HR06]|nr:hypothetical protein HRbin06_01079 [archaeon HR06]